MPGLKSGPVLTAAHRALARELAVGPAGLAVTCASPSMEPTIRVGEVVTVHAGRVRRGDVFLFEHASGALGLHRLIARLPGGWIVHCGDHPTAQPGVTRVEQIIGRAEVARRRPTARQAGRAARLIARRTVARVIGRR